jgi:predicted transcriptional regulator
MATRKRRITVEPDWRAALRRALVQELLGAGEVPARELARQVGRDVQRAHGDLSAPRELGPIERTARGGVSRPHKDIHIDFHLRSAA